MEPSPSWDDIGCMHNFKADSNKDQSNNCVSYQKLVVPAKMRSVYWKGFGFPANEKGEILTKKKIICLFCQSSIAYNRNTSNLRMHLESKHRSKLEEFEANAIRSKRGQRQVEKRSEESVIEMGTVEHLFMTDDDAGSSAAKVKVKKLNRSLQMQPHSSLVEITVPTFLDEDEEGDENEEMATIENAVTEFLVVDLISPCVVEGSGFQRLLSVLRPGTTEISREKVEGPLLSQCYTALRDAILEELSQLQSFGISIEEWKSGNGNVFLSISAHLIKQDSEIIESRVLTTLLLPLQSEIWSLTILDILQKWGIVIEKVAIVVIGSSHYEMLASKLRACGLKVVPCLVFTLQLAIDKCYKIDQVSRVISKCHSLQENFPADPQPSSGDAPIPNLWRSTFKFLHDISQKQEICPITSDQENLSEEELPILQCIINILTPFTVVIDTLVEEKVASVALVKPFICQMLRCHLKDIDSDNDVTRTFKLILRDELSTYFLEEDVDEWLTMASYLDPRFKSLDLNYQLIVDHVKSELESICKDELPEPPESKQPRLSGMGMLFGNICKSKSTLSKSERIQIELNQYQSEDSSSFDVCPVQWWSATRTKCPNLAVLARKFLSVPASSIPSQLLSTANRVKFQMHRAAINSESADKLIFLNANKNLFSFQDS